LWGRLMKRRHVMVMKVCLLGTGLAHFHRGGSHVWLHIAWWNRGRRLKAEVVVELTASRPSVAMHGMHRVGRWVRSEDTQVGNIIHLLLVLRFVINDGRMRDNLFGPRLRTKQNLSSKVQKEISLFTKNDGCFHVKMKVE